MFRSLRSRLLLSYVTVISTVLVVMTIFLLAASLSAQLRFDPTWRELIIIARSVDAEIVRARQAGIATIETERFEQFLGQIATNQNVRVLAVLAGTREVIFDSQGDSWVGETISTNPIRSVLAVDENISLGHYEAPDGSNWLVLTQALATFRGRNQLFIVYTRPRPTPFAIFRQLFFSPLCQAGLAAFVVAVLLMLWLNRSVTRPLKGMVQASEAMSAGDYAQQVPVQGPEEIQRVALSFNKMATQVQKANLSQRDFVANVSHDLKTPLTSIQGWSQALLDEVARTPEQVGNAAAIIHSEAERMNRMVSQLLDLARIESGQLKLNLTPISLSDLLTDVYNNLLVQAQNKQIQLTQALSPVSPILGDGDRLMQVFTNLVDNALTHTPTGGRVHLVVRPHGEKAVEVLVQDTGKGIPPDELERIFERFYQVEKSRTQTGGRKGAGLGLAIAKELVEAQRGRISAHSQPGKGTTMAIRFPLSSAPENSTITRTLS
ncbi:MAG: HAMP domain-containing histidine kinase [Chloroflexi bacterium]|nr:HAMP domain-containing histidine kinase [Chloroflexota bacterium]MBP8057911.1 HAMP domain-containing histidine kinase [Chloroflexota bacterium]